MKARLGFRRRTASVIDAMLTQLPAGDPRRTTFQTRAHAYSTECGCAMGAIFLVVALVLSPLYLATSGKLDMPMLILGVVSIFIASMAGKALGLAVASVRLVLLLWQLRRRLGQEGSRPGVYVH